MKKDIIIEHISIIIELLIAYSLTKGMPTKLFKDHVILMDFDVTVYSSVMEADKKKT